MTINIGKMRERITIQKRTISIVKGVKIEDWHTDTPYYSCSAEFLDLYGQEKYSAYQSKLENSLKFRVRYCNLLKKLIGNTKDFRVVWNDGIYNLLFVDSISLNKKEMILQVNKVS